MEKIDGNEQERLTQLWACGNCLGIILGILIVVIILELSQRNVEII